MGVVDRLGKLLPQVKQLAAGRAEALTEIRLRSGRPVQALGEGFEALSPEILEAAALQKALASLMDYSLYARQDELDSGFFTLDDGSRVGVCGRVFAEPKGLRMAEIGSACIRVARQIPGCADSLIDLALDAGGLNSTLLISPPGMGKTTLLRDVARQLSRRGYCVGIADERHELAACHRGVPTLDVGPRSDVMDGCSKPEAIRRMLRAMAPHAIVADEIGSAGDAQALADAVRCGVAIAASAHAADISAARSRPVLREILDSGMMRHVVLLGPRPGIVQRVWRGDGGEEEPACRRA